MKKATVKAYAIVNADGDALVLEFAEKISPVAIFTSQYDAAVALGAISEIRDDSRIIEVEVLKSE